MRFYKEWKRSILWVWLKFEKGLNAFGFKPVVLNLNTSHKAPKNEIGSPKSMVLLGETWKKKKKGTLCILDSTFTAVFRVSCVFFFFSPQLLTSQLWTVHPCTVHESYKLHFLVTFSLKMGLTALFTHLKIILLNFQFQQNKFYPNRLYMQKKKKVHSVLDCAKWRPSWIFISV